MKKIIYVISILLLVNVSLAQNQELSSKNKKAKKLFDKAFKSLNNRDLESAVVSLESALLIDDNFVEAWVMLGDIYSISKNCKKSVPAYKKSLEIDKDFFPYVNYSIAGELMKCGEFSKAAKYYEISKMVYHDNPKQIEIIDSYIEVCNFRADLMSKPVKFNPVNLGANINNEWDEYLPSLTADEETFVFTVRRPRDRYTACAVCKHEEDFYISHKDDFGNWLPRNPLGPPVNTNYNEGAQSISPDGKYLIFTACERPDNQGSCDLYLSKLVGGKWTEPKNIGPPVNTPHWESQPAFAADGRTVYFASNRPRGAGGIDIWKTKIDDDDRFSVPENIGPPINTPGDEVSPFIHPDGKTLYFASDGHLGMGGMDLFVSRLMDNNQWSEPQNLGYPINTIGEEANLIVNARGNIAYFSSNKKGGFGGMDLYWFELDESIRPQSVTYLKGRVFDQKDRRPIEAVVELYDLSTGELFSSIKSDVVNGEFLVCIPTNNSYALNVNKTGYLFFSENFDLVGVHSETEPYHKDIPLKNISVGEIVVLKNVFFDTDKFDLKAESILELNKLVDLLKQNKSIKIEIGGHTDNQGSQAHNKTLSQNRAKAVYEYLISKNIDKSRLTYQGYGIENPIATNDTPEGRALNRRTEFKIIEL